MDNLLDPLLFDDRQISAYVRDHVCYCGAALIYKPAARQWIAACPDHGPIIAGMAVRKATMEHIAGDQRAAMSELRQPSGKTNPEILAELGF